ncbi:acyl-CoA dehydrogenase [Actinoplanes lobatus]|uniref:Acyl-CoA dehydrogenase n=1 Tax=Actinoplanes lobatus TaxID=113568 RepID=A0A7W7MJC3_9ACTN|nr:acyl-CoA dehydrogenase family protein [Actinoplanes lobatus]MBB4752419.1 alkylation response protein AidB-like acyl-CoA dehydrogenase [Actinoplanes lobatus]GGN99643.1 acyl-CoA dehydrogenase [Actinoplanes lobatus]GIE46375.1 acyl-CoA dehydrogenase [Actinoplanes lobatus]
MSADLAGIRAVLAELAEGAGERDRTGEHPYALIRKLADAGFGRLRVPREFGGHDLTLPELFEVLAEAGQADSNVPQIWRGHFTTTEILRRETDRAVREKWFRAIGEGAVFGNAQSEPSALAAEGVVTRVRTGADGRRLVSGTKFYSTGARFADWIRAAVTDDDGDRGFVVISARHPGVKHVDDWDGIGQRQTGSGTTIFTDVPVEDLGDVGRYREALAGLDSFVQIVHLANLAGIARNLVAETVTLVRRRTRTSLHGLTESAAEDPEVLGVIGTLQARRLVADTLLRHAAERLEAAHRDGDFTRAYQDTSTAQIASIEAVLDAAAIAFDALGSSAARSPVHLDRHWRNARTLASHNPVIYKPRVVGDYLVNGRAPEPGYYRGRQSLSSGSS